MQRLPLAQLRNSLNRVPRVQIPSSRLTHKCLRLQCGNDLADAMVEKGAQPSIDAPNTFQSSQLEPRNPGRLSCNGLIRPLIDQSPFAPFSAADGHNAPRLVFELAPCVAAMSDDIVVGFEDAV